MLAFLQRIFRPEPPLVRGAGSDRPKSYSADSGYVYEYSFGGFRHVRGLYEYMFQVSGGRVPVVSVRVVLPEDNLQAWAGRNRELTASERYGIAKVCLKRALDRASDPKSLVPEVAPGAEEIADVADLLDL